MYPFLAWVVVGGIMLVSISRRDIFYAVNTHYSAAADFIMYYVTWMGEGSIIVTALLALLLAKRFRNWWFFANEAACNVIPFVVQQTLKSLFNWPRPRLLYYDRLWVHYLPEWPVLLERSFPSGHSTGAFSFFCFLSLLLTAKNKWWGAVFFLLAISVCYSRLYLAAHFFEDVYAGSIIGTVLTTIIFSVMNKYKDRFFAKK